MEQNDFQARVSRLAAEGERRRAEAKAERIARERARRGLRTLFDQRWLPGRLIVFAGALLVGLIGGLFLPKYAGPSFDAWLQGASGSLFGIRALTFLVIALAGLAMRLTQHPALMAICALTVGGTLSTAVVATYPKQVAAVEARLGHPGLLTEETPEQKAHAGPVVKRY
ncbi:hypothetical protein [Pontivivens ytuae]|uniref:Uncharacterized protein n=1 Tax=Pontivivens ytuae TaxID=2789856 RepID=A0A7S9LRP0_9RHOB|nr:hypothetical protein [Pontivivens ytuae]QPH53740.1 hypothetical protein I0K15_18485 [Pontivivens ytuae]